MAVIERIVLDSTPLALLCQRRGFAAADQCRHWLVRHVSAGVRVYVPEVIDYEVRRELLRMRKVVAVQMLDGLIGTPPDRLMRVSPATFATAAALWASSRQAGTPTADPLSLDIDVVFAAQVLVAGWDMSKTIVATGNVRHLKLFVPAAEWATI